MLLPLFFIRFGLLGLLDKSALKRAAHFAPPRGRERIAYYCYQASNLVLVIYPFFLTLQVTWPMGFAGLLCYLVGILVLVLSTVAFAAPGPNGLNEGGIYRVSRNPMYLGYFLYFLGCAALMRSALFLAVLLVFQLSAHWVIRWEERWCEARFGGDYTAYMRRVRRYL